MVGKAVEPKGDEAPKPSTDMMPQSSLGVAPWMQQPSAFPIPPMSFPPFSMMPPDMMLGMFQSSMMPLFPPMMQPSMMDMHYMAAMQGMGTQPPLGSFFDPTAMQIAAMMQQQQQQQMAMAMAAAAAAVAGAGAGAGAGLGLGLPQITSQILVGSESHEAQERNPVPPPPAPSSAALSVHDTFPLTISPPSIPLPLPLPPLSSMIMMMPGSQLMANPPAAIPVPPASKTNINPAPPPPSFIHENLEKDMYRKRFGSGAVQEKNEKRKQANRDSARRSRLRKMEGLEVNASQVSVLSYKKQLLEAHLAALSQVEAAAVQHGSQMRLALDVISKASRVTGGGVEGVGPHCDDLLALLPKLKEVEIAYKEAVEKLRMVEASMVGAEVRFASELRAEEEKREEEEEERRVKKRAGGGEPELTVQGIRNDTVAVQGRATKQDEDSDREEEEEEEDEREEAAAAAAKAGLVGHPGVAPDPMRIESQGRDATLAQQGTYPEGGGGGGGEEDSRDEGGLLSVSSSEGTRDRPVPTSILGKESSDSPAIGVEGRDHAAEADLESYRGGPRAIANAAAISF